MVTHIYEWASNCRPKMARALLLPFRTLFHAPFSTSSFAQLAPGMARVARPNERAPATDLVWAEQMLHTDQAYTRRSVVRPS